ncbi:MAG: mucoidy inhibitor MuiA family protein [Bacteroidota bacterium]
MNVKFSFLLIWFAAGSLFSAEPVALPSTVTSVTVYSDRAAVTRMGQVSLQTGNYLLSFDNLPANILDQSIRVSGEAAGAKIVDVHVGTTFLDTIPEERIRTLQSKVQELQAGVNELNDRLSILNTERDFIQQIKAQTADNINKDLKVQRPTIEDWQKVLAFFDSNLNKNFAEQRKIVSDCTDIQNKIDALEKQIHQISLHTRRSVKNIVVGVLVEKAGEVRLFPTYVVRGALWYPQYDVRISTGSQDVELDYYGFVQQSTGEDWTNVDISLSTARPDVGGVKPELFPWYLKIAEPVGVMEKSRSIAPARAANNEVVVSAQAAASGAMQPMEVPVAEVEIQTTSALFHIPSQSTIPSDNVTHKVMIAIDKLHADFSYSSTPKLSPFVYLKATVKNNTPEPLLGGKANIFSNDDFVATSSLKTVSPNETFDAYLGADPAIKIERKLINKFTDYTGTFTKNVRVTYEFSYSLENTKKTEQTVSVQDQLPVSQNEKIAVEQVEPAEKDIRQDSQGFLNWNMTLTPGEKKNWRLKFNIEYPQGTAVLGLE